MPKKLIDTLNEISFKNNFFLFFSENNKIQHSLKCVFFQEKYTDMLMKECLKNSEKNIILLGIHTIFRDISPVFPQNIADYINIPCSPFEIALRIKKHINTKNWIEEKTLKYKEIEYNIETNFVKKNEEEIHLGKMQKRLLKIFLELQEKTISPLQIQEKLWNDIYPESTSRNIRSNIQDLKKTMQKYHCDYIQNIRGEGYKFIKT